MALTQVKTLGIAPDAVNGTKIADDACDSEHYTDGSIDHAHLAGDCVDGDNIADDSIGAEHIADNAVGLAAMAGGTDGQIITYDASGDPVAVGPGTDGQVLTSTGAGSPPAFEDLPTSGATLSGSTNDQVVTVTGANAMTGESGLTFTGGHLTIGNGSLVVGTAGHGIDFSITSEAASGTFSMTAEKLDDYEEGTWTPVISGRGYTYTAGNYKGGHYTKIGRMVQIEGMVNVTGISGSSDGSTTRISIPFAPVAPAGGANWNRSPCTVVYIDSGAVAKMYGVQLSVNSSSLDVTYGDSGVNSSNASVDLGNDWQSGSTNTQISFGMSYITNS